MNESFDPSSVRRPGRGVALTFLNTFAPTRAQQALDWREKKQTDSDKWMVDGKAGAHLGIEDQGYAHLSE